jgi:hypothetical protein
VRLCNARHDGFTETAALRDNPYNLDITRPPAPKLVGDRGDGTIVHRDPSQARPQGLPARMCDGPEAACLVTRADESPDICRRR